MTRKFENEKLVRQTRRLFAVSVSCAAFAATGAAAQDFDPQTRIEDRPRPDYASRPIAVGAFEVVPRIEVGAEYVDNLFSSDLLSVDDVIVSVRPSISVADRRPDREIRLNLATGYQTYLNNNADDRVQVSGNARVRFGLGTSTRPFAGAKVSLNDSSQSQVTVGGNINQPLKALTYGANAGLAQDIGPFTVEGEGRVNRSQYDGQYIYGNQAFDVAFRNNTFYQGRGRLSYSVRPDQRVYVEGRLGRFDYDGSLVDSSVSLPPVLLKDRSSQAFTIAAGVAFQVTELLALDANAGFSKLTYDDSTQSSFDAFAFEVNAYYSPSRLTRFQLQAARSVDESDNPLFSSFLRTGVALRGEHELRRNLVLRADLEYANYDAGEEGSIGDEYRGSVGATYYVSPHVSLNLRGEIFSRTGISEGEQKRLLISAAYSF